MKVIFLDFDGVLVIPRTRRQSASRAVADPGCVAALNHVLAVTGAMIVVSASARGSELSPMKDLLYGWGVTPRTVVGITPRLEREAGAAAVPRGREIKAWLDERERHRGDVEQFVILDDGDDMEELLARLVRTDYERGLTYERAEQAINLLSEEPGGRGE